MATSNEQIFDQYVRHQIYLMRYAGGISKKVNELLKGTESKLSETVLSYLNKLEGRNLYSAQTRKILKEFDEAIAAIRGKPWRLIDELFANEMQELAVAEASHAAVVIQGAVPVLLNLSTPPVDQLKQIAASMPFEGKTLKRWARGMAQADVDRISSTVKRGISQNLPIGDIAKSIVPPDTDLTDRAVARKAMRDARALALTVVNGVSTQSRAALYEENADIIETERFVATLDSHTTLQCADNDGKIFKRGEGPMTPLHFRCRSLRVPFISADNLRNRGFDPTTERQLLREFAEQNNLKVVTTRANLPYGTKTKFDQFARKRTREMVGQVPAKTTYSEWFPKQSEEFQRDVLGPTRLKMYKEGNLSLDTFIDYNGRTLTLNELREKGLSVP